MSAWVELVSPHAALEDPTFRLEGAALRERIELRARELSDDVRTGDRVVLARERSIAWVVDLCALASIGAVPIPIDPALPEARRQAIGRDASFLIDDSRGLSRLGEPPYAREELAYLVYTSGSSGAPKGVRIGHAGLVPMLRAQIDAFELDPSARVLAYLSPGFDAFLSDVLTALLSGATLCFAPRDRLASLGGLVRALSERRITHLDFPPSLLAHLDITALPASLRCVVVGGEPASISGLRALARRTKVVNVYGPTEATICTSLCTVDPDRWDRPLLGQPIAGARYRVSDDGELWIASPGLALGYVDREEETARAFVWDGGERWYRTGDRVEHESGEWVFLGRVDRQVKIAGVRVELDEVEAVLCAQVRAAAVVRREEGLVAFFEGEAEGLTLRRELARVLPQAAVPRRIVRVPSLPRSTSGKIDRAALETAPIEALVHDPPRGEDEELVAALFERVLGHRVGRRARFWDEGGDSFAVLELCALAEAMGVPLSPSRLSEAATVEALAAQGGAVRYRAPSLEREAERAWLESGDAGESDGAALQLDGRCAVITGAAGFLGARVLDEWLARSELRAVCLVRRDVELPRGALAVRADLAAPRLGLSGATYRALAERTDVILHCAGSVRVTDSYASLYDANVRASANVARLALRAGARVIHAGSLAPFVSCDAPPPLAREDDEAPPSAIAGAYAATKWIAERVVANVASANVRLGLLTGDSRTGRSHRACQLELFLRGLAAVGVAPLVEAPLFVDITPVDHAARAMVDLALARDARGTFHVASREPASYEALLAALERAGASLPRVAPAVFFEAVTRAIAERRQVGTAALGLARRLRDSSAALETDLFLATATRFDTSRADAFTEPIGAPSFDLLTRYARTALA